MLVLSKKILKKKNEKVFYKHYKDLFHSTLEALNLKDLIKVSKMIEKKIIKNKNIFVAGNGGSASVANHFLCDFNKGIKLSSKKIVKPKVISLANSLELITAISNDLNYEKIFSFQLENFANNDDLLITFSCSGSSKNIVNAVKLAKTLGLNIICISGFGKKNKIADINLNLNCKNYGVTEDIFSYIMHTTSQFIRSKYQNNNIL
jgi:phosphoheptose isomerase